MGEMMGILLPDHKYIAVCPECGEVRGYSAGEPKYVVRRDLAAVSCTKDKCPMQKYVIFKRIGEMKLISESGKVIK